MPSTKDERYVDTADNRFMSSRNCMAEVRLLVLAYDIKRSKFVLLVLKPFALTQVLLGGSYPSPAHAFNVLS